MKRFLLKSAFEQQCRKHERENSEPNKIQQVRPDCSQSNALEQHGFEPVD
jgi:hypothetical protein